MEECAKRWRDLGITEKVRLIIVASLAVAIGVVSLAHLTAGLYQIIIDDLWVPIVREHYAAMVGLLFAAILSTLLVLVFNAAYGNIKIKGLGIECEGAAGPLILWIFMFLTMSSATALVWWCYCKIH